MKTALIGLSGLAGCGKTSLALALVKDHNFVRISFADPIRSMAVGLGLTLEQMKEHKNEPLDWLGGHTPREIMQSLGTEWGRRLVCDDVWVRVAKERILRLWAGGAAGIVIDDCRFDNEAAMVKEMGGAVVQINRPGLQRMNHASEAGVSDRLIDAIFENDGDSIETLHAYAKCLAIGYS